MTNHISNCEISQQEFDKMRWDLLNKEDEIQHLQKALGEAQMQLLTDRSQLVDIKFENDELKSRVLFIFLILVSSSARRPQKDTNTTGTRQR